MSEDVATAARAVDPARLHRFARDVFGGIGMTPADADRMADYFVWVELHGFPFLGARRIPEFVARVRDGGTRPDGPAPTMIVQDRPAFAVVDAHDTFAQLTGSWAMDLAVDKARAAGTGAVVVRNTTTAGALGYYPMLAAGRGMIGLAINNTPAVMAAHGAASRALGAQPFAVASPAGQHPPLLLDMTNSAMSMARMYEYQRRGERIPGDVALTVDGEPTTDATAAIAGILLPMAAHRGYGLALMWEVLTGVLAGGPRFGDGVAMPYEHATPTGGSLFLLALDPAAAMPHEEFTARVDTLVELMHGAEPAPGVDRVTVPGERSQARAAAGRRDGLTLPADVLAGLQELGAELGASSLIDI